MLNCYLIDGYRYLTNTSMIPYLIDPLLMLNWYYRYYSDSADTTVTYQYLVNSYIVKQYLTDPDQYLNDSYRLVILKTEALLE